VCSGSGRSRFFASPIHADRLPLPGGEYLRIGSFQNSYGRLGFLSE